VSAYTDIAGWSRPMFAMPGRYMTVAAIAWEIGRKGSNLWLIVPKGFEFDVSVPFWARWLCDPRNPRYAKAACLHDHALSQGWDRVSAAAVFADALKADGVSRWRRLAMTVAVIIWNWS